jgi:hypothetical protein
MVSDLQWMRKARRYAAFLALIAASLLLLMPAPLAAGETGPAIWKASKGGATVYLFGTIHILEPGQNWFTAKIRSRFERSHTLALEMADIRGSSSEAVRLVRQLGAYPPRDSLANHIGERSYMRLQSTMSRLGAPPVALYRMRPWVALMVFSTHALAADGRLLEYGADRNLHRLALTEKKRVIGLESMEAHLRVFADLPEDLQIRMLEDSLQGLSSSNPLYRPLVEAWLAGDVEELGRLMTAEMGEASPLFHQRLLLDRNRNWIKPIERMLAGKGSYFVAAGAGHFAGEGNVVDLLRARGVTVVRE